MHVQICLENSTVDDLLSLASWLNDETELRGRIQIANNPIVETELGAVPEFINLLLGAGGTAVSRS